MTALPMSESIELTPAQKDALFRAGGYVSDDATVVDVADLIRLGLVQTETDYDGLMYVLTKKGAVVVAEIVEAQYRQDVATLSALIKDLRPSLPAISGPICPEYQGVMLDVRDGEADGSCIRLYLLDDGDLVEVPIIGLKSNDRFDDEKMGNARPPLWKISARKAAEKYAVVNCAERIRRLVESADAADRLSEEPSR